jgi:MFS transporter, ACS family, tartrate transporter
MTAPADDAIGAKTMRTVALRVLPILLAAYLAAYIDRVNVGFAALTANQDLGLTPVQFGFGAGLFFLGYCGAQVPSNLAMLRFGPRIWFARILITMGLIAAATAFVVGPRSFYWARLALGVAEAGLLPGAIYYFRRWFPTAFRARFIAVFLLAIPLSSLLGAPISGFLLDLDGLLGLKGWQWMYILEGLPCVVFGVMLPWFIADDPARVNWLTPEQRDWLIDALRREDAALATHGPEPAWWKLCVDPRVLTYGTAFCGMTAGGYGLSFWLPLMVKAHGLSNVATGFVVAVPFAVGCAATLLWAWHSDRSGERVWHVALPGLVAAAGLCVCAAVDSLTLGIIALTFAALGIYGVRGPYFALQSEEFAAAAAAPGIAWIDMIAATGGFLGPFIVGWFRQETGGFAASLLALAAMAAVGAGIILLRAALVRRFARR